MTKKEFDALKVSEEEFLRALRQIRRIRSKLIEGLELDGINYDAKKDRVDYIRATLDDDRQGVEYEVLNSLEEMREKSWIEVDEEDCYEI